MENSATPVVQILQGGFARMPAAIFAVLFLALMFIGLKASLAALRSTRILMLVARTPAFDVGAGGYRTRFTRVGPIMVHTASGLCLVDTRRAEVVRSRSDVRTEFLDSNRYTVNKARFR